MRRPRSATRRPIRASASISERREASNTTPSPTTRAYPAEAMAPNSAVPCRPPVAALAATATVMRAHSDTVSANLVDT